MTTISLATKVSEVMTTDLYKVTLDQSLTDVEALFRQHKIRHMPVVDDKKLLGIISLTDIQRLSFGDMYEHKDEEIDWSVIELLSVEQVMRHKVVIISPDEDFEKAAEILTKAEFHALPVVEENGNLAGIITTTDVIRVLLEIARS